MASEMAADHILDCFQSAESQEYDPLCAICFEKTSFVDLPCSCKIDYCLSCWDRALAFSIRARGQAQCPSCRSSFVVDFDQHDACLVFSKAEIGMTLMEWKSRLYDKTRTVQIQILKDFAAVAHAVMKGEEPSSPRDSLRHEPICMCGGVLEKVDKRMRTIRMLEEVAPKWMTSIPEDDPRIDQLVDKCLISCDLCGDIANRTGFLWTCSKGPYTVLHPAAYDICDSCFSRHTACSRVPSNTSLVFASSSSSRNPCEHASPSRTSFAMLPWHSLFAPQTFAASGESSSGTDSNPAPGVTRARSGNA